MTMLTTIRAKGRGCGLRVITEVRLDPVEADAERALEQLLVRQRARRTAKALLRLLACLRIGVATAALGPADLELRQIAIEERRHVRQTGALVPAGERSTFDEGSARKLAGVVVLAGCCVTTPNEGQEVALETHEK